MEKFNSVPAKTSTIDQALISVIPRTSLSTSVLSKTHFHQKQTVNLDVEKASPTSLQSPVPGG